MGEITEIATELRDEVLQTILAVRLSLAHSAAHSDADGMRRHSVEAHEHLAAEARRLRALIDRLGALAGRLEPTEAPARDRTPTAPPV